MIEHVYRNQTVRIADLTRETDMVTNIRFEGCSLIGPAVLVLAGYCKIDGCTIAGDGNHAIESMFWDVTGRRWLLGAVALRDCQLQDCWIARCGFAGTTEQIAFLARGFGMVQ